MRRIEHEMVDALIANVSYWHKSNTTIKRYGREHYIYLHDNHIATVLSYMSAPLRHRVIANTETLALWPTATTKSRLRALGVNVHTRKGKTYINDECIID